MSIQNPIADMFTCIRNAQLSKKKNIIIYYSRFKESILKIFYNEGFIKKYIVFLNEFKNRKIKIYLKYYCKVPVISIIKQISKPGLRIYKSYKNLPLFLSGLGVVIISTSKGILSDKQARNLNIGGEIICYIY